MEPRSLPAGGTRIAVLTAIRTGRHGRYDRVVLNFDGSFGAVRVGYLAVVREDPSDRVLAVRGEAFLGVTLHQAVAGWPSVPGKRYTGPSTVTPDYPTLKQVKISGDFEAVLSFAVGLGRRAGFQVSRLRAPDRLVIDVAAPPAWPFWPDTSLGQAQSTQAAVSQGHQPWRLDPASVAGSYGRLVYGWDDPVVARAAGTNTYRVSGPRAGETITLRMVQPVRPGAGGIWEVADGR